MKTKAIVILATTWGSKHGGLNAFSTRLCKALPSVVSNVSIYCVCMTASKNDIADAEAFGLKLVQLGISESEVRPEWAQQIVSLLRDTHKIEVLWWIGHDIKTGELALQCKNISEGKFGVIMHMSYGSYAYVKHPKDSKENLRKEDLQKTIFRAADKRFAVGPLLYDKLYEIVGNSKGCRMIVPGLSEIVPDVRKKERISIISFGRYDISESLTKGGPLGIVAFARTVKLGFNSYIKALSESDLTVIGVPEEQADNLRSMAHKEAERVVNIKVLPFIDDQEKIKELLTDSNVCLMLSWHEGFGLTAWEAISAGIPVIIPKNSGVYHLLEELGGAVMGCIHYVDIKGTPDGSPNEEDIKNVIDCIFQIGTNITRAVSNALSLRSFLSSRRLTWTSCAETIANELEIPIVQTSIGLHESSETYNETLEDFELSQANNLLKSAKDDYDTGSYLQALQKLKELDSFKIILEKSYTIAMDATLLRGEIYLRQNKYPEAKALANRLSSISFEKQDWVRYCKGKFIENIIYRDQGYYENAIRIGEELRLIIEDKIPDNPILESCYRKLSRSLSLNGEWVAALDLASKAAEMTEKRGFKKGEPLSLLAIAESYRHGLDFQKAITYYKKSQSLAAGMGHTDCYLWAALGLCDALYLNQENPKKLLLKLETYLKANKNSYPLEKLHVSLSLFSITARYEGINDYPTSIIEQYEELGIKWPKSYVDNILKKDYSNPKKF